MKLKEIPQSLFYTFRLKGLNLEKLLKPKQNSLPVIVSLTTIPSRMEKVHITLRSILNQKRPPQKILLWLNENDKNSIPKSLKDLEGEILNIAFTPLTCSHKKLIHTIAAYPESIIVTCDDDFIYDENWLGKLYDEHLKHPTSIVANRVRQIRTGADGKLLPYKEWNMTDKENTKAFLAIGSDGILYPPKSLPEMANNSDIFLELAPRADDLWFKAMALLKGTSVVKTSNFPVTPIPLLGTQSTSLKKFNIDQNLNVTQWERLAEYFKLDISGK